MRVGKVQHLEAGFTYASVLGVIAVLGVGLVAASEVWVATAHRQKLAQLEWVGEQFVLGLGSYYYSSSGTVKIYPKTLRDLLEDRRFLTMRRHLREIYANPFTGKPDWELIIGDGGGIKGVQVAIPSSDGVQIRRFEHSF